MAGSSGSVLLLALQFKKLCLKLSELAHVFNRDESKDDIAFLNRIIVGEVNLTYSSAVNTLDLNLIIGLKRAGSRVRIREIASHGVGCYYQRYGGIHNRVRKECQQCKNDEERYHRPYNPSAAALCILVLLHFSSPPFT